MLRSFTIVLIIFTAFAVWTVYAPDELEEPVQITIEPGASVNEIIDALSDQGVIDNELFAKLYIKLQGMASRLQAGEYTFSDKVSLATVFEKLVSPQGSQAEIILTFPEGWTIDDMAEYVGAQTDLSVSSEAFITASEDLSLLPDGIHIPKGRDLEGYLFPDTYHVFEDVTAEELIKKMLVNFNSKVTDEMRTEIDAQNRTLDEVVILASMLEKELLSINERKLGADVFLKRLEIGMGLQADSTVNYITKKKTSRASAEDIKIDSPYNTYKHRGLPPGPISNPGFDSLEAAIYPTGNAYYYFLTTPEGDAIFSTTLEEHNTAKRRYY